MAAKLTAAGYALSDPYGNCGTVIVNTCGFIEKAKEESIAEILAAAERQSEYKGKLIVTGCLAQRYRDEILSQLPEVDAVVGLAENADIAEIVAGGSVRHSHGEWRIDRQVSYDKLPPSGAYAYLRIADGCDNRCSYCSIPTFRGGFTARPPDDILGEAAARVRQGVGELVLVAQDVTAYKYESDNLVSLLRKLLADERLGGVKFRLLYCYPERITDALIDLIADEPRIQKYLDMPLQHCSDEILRDMNRKSTRAGLTALLTKLRERIPNIALRSTFIVGFPGETDAQWTELCEFVRDCRFDYAGCFAYSAEEGTAAAEMPCQIDEFVKQRRADILEEQFAVWQDEKLRGYVGSVVPVLVIGDGVGYAPFQAPEIDSCVYFNDCGSVTEKYIDVKLLGYEDGDFEGEII